MHSILHSSHFSFRLFLDPVLVRRASQIKQHLVSIATRVTTHIKESFTRENIAAFIS